MNKITIEIRRMIKEYNKKCISPMLINSGYCYNFAMELKKGFPRGRVIWGERHPELFVTDVCPIGHCFFRYGNKYYDAESENGVNTPDELQYYQRILSLSSEWKPFEKELDKIQVV